MRLALYDELVSWYSLLDPLEDHERECVEYRQTLEGALGAGRHTLLELGSGAGHNAFFLKRAFDCTLSDVSTAMLGLSRGLNPECEHVLGDMRTLRLGRSFDAVFVHDAIVYMASEPDLRAAAETAFTHTRPGGTALFVPDTFRDAFVESSDVHEGTDGERTLKCLEWTWDPDPSDDSYSVEYAFLLRDGAELRAVHDRHVEGLFSRATWLRILSEVGFSVEALPRSLEVEEAERGYALEMFSCRRPTSEMA